jgi:hypothetical protein
MTFAPTSPPAEQYQRDLAAGTGKLTEVLAAVAAMTAVGDVLERHGIDHTTIPLKTMITSAERRDG